MQTNPFRWDFSLPLLLALALAGCSGSSTDDSVVVEGSVPVAYVKRPINPTAREVAGNPTDSLISRSGSDLYVRRLSSGAAKELNITSAYTQGRGDVSDPEVSYDGRKVLFSMKGPNDATWDLWEADVSGIVSGSSDSARLCRLTNDNGKSRTDPNITWGDDVDPAYLLDGRVVFSSNRQEKTYRQLGRKYIDEYERESTIVLHTMSIRRCYGSNELTPENDATIEQISFNMSHDRNPTVLRSGEIMFSRWDHVGTRNQFTIFKVNPDGTGMFVVYGAHGSANSFLHPREMPDGRILSDAMPLQRTNEGGALLIIDAKNYGEVNQPAPNAAGAVAQYQPTVRQISYGANNQPNGRFTTPHPLWDGSFRALVSFNPALRTERVQETSVLTGQQQEVERELTPAYGVYVIELESGNMSMVAFPRVDDDGRPIEMIVDPIPLQARDMRSSGSIVTTIESSRSGSSTTTGRLTVKSVYDTDSENRMNNAVLNEWERGGTLLSPNPQPVVIPTVSASSLACSEVDGRPRYPNCDTRRNVADLARIKNPDATEGTPPHRRAGRFVRIIRAVPTVSGTLRETIGETDFEMQQIVGYVPLEPDGSFTAEVPADTPLGISVVDAYGRAFQTHTSWLQVRPGENVTCKGCHSPRRSSPVALNQRIGTTGAGFNPHSAPQDNAGNVIGAAQGGETMAETRLRLGTSPALSTNLDYRDVWTNRHDVTNAVLPKGADINVRYDGATRYVINSDGTITNNVVTAGIAAGERPYQPADGGIVINYPEHIQPIWNRVCVSCHSSTGTPPDLSAGVSGTGRAISYESLLFERPLFNADGTPRLEERDGEIVLATEEGSAMVYPGLARTTRLIAKIFPDGLINPATLAADANNHAALLTPSEKRVAAEWVDLGAQYFNDRCIRDASLNCTSLRVVVGLSEATFNASVRGILSAQCAGCHFAAGRGPNDPPLAARRFVLTGATEGDLNVTVSMVNNVCNAGMSYLLLYPTAGAAASAAGLPTPATAHPLIFSSASPDYAAIAAWINAAGAANGCP